MEMKPEWLPNLVLLEKYQNNWDKYIEALYDYFCKDFVYDKPLFRGTMLVLKRLPLGKDGKEATFWHMISEGRIEQERTPDLRRCERIRWPKPIVEHSECNNIKVWENERRGEKRICLWFEDIEYLVVLAKRNGYILFWTAYLVKENHKKRKLNKEFEEFREAGDAPKDGTVTPSTHGR